MLRVSKTLRIESQVAQFITQARSTGLEKHWISLLRGQNVETTHLQQLDNLLKNVLEKPTPQTLDQNRPWAESFIDPISKQSVLKWEIPKATRLELKEKALQQATAEKSSDTQSRAKEIYRASFNELRSKLIQLNASKQKGPIYPTLKVGYKNDSPYQRYLFDMEQRFKTLGPEERERDFLRRQAEYEEKRPDLLYFTPGTVRLFDYLYRKPQPPADQLRKTYDQVYKDFPFFVNSKKLNWKVSDPVARTILDKWKALSFVVLKAYSPLELNHEEDPLERIAEAGREKAFNHTIANLGTSKRTLRNIEKFVSTWYEDTYRQVFGDVTWDNLSPEVQADVLLMFEKQKFFVPLNEELYKTINL